MGRSMGHSVGTSTKQWGGLWVVGVIWPCHVLFRAKGGGGGGVDLARHSTARLAPTSSRHYNS